ncbi:MAG: cytochrome c maturation protein CcmE [Devosiaceae bacterium]|nr:cytochrome c maturation protein CcmE [Devosiaceae bacterium]
MTRKQKRLSIIAGLGLVIALAAILIFTALSDKITFFYSPSELQEDPIAVGQAFRLGGLVQEDSWVKEGEYNIFYITDNALAVKVIYKQILPDLFREGQGVIAEGSLDAEGVFIATNVLAKHDENYIPKEVVDTLKERGEWKEDEQGDDY